jgi:hypothetical protein
MQPQRRGRAIRASLAAALLLVGLASLGLWRVLSSNEALPYDDAATPPSTAQVSNGETYSLAVPGGVAAMEARGVPVSAANGAQVIALQCTYTAPGYNGVALTVSPELTTTKAENTVGHFIAPVSGRIRVDCSGWGTMFVPDSDDRTTDWAGFTIVVAVLTLTIGAGLGLAEMRQAMSRVRDRESDDDDDDDDDDGYGDDGYPGDRYGDAYDDAGDEAGGIEGEHAAGR